MFVCTECGGTKFTVNSGYHYCTECNTQSQAIGIKINFTNVDKPDLKEETTKKSLEYNHHILRNREISTYEEFNYILSGLINQLYLLNAKDEIKLTAVQLWTTYLRKLEIAFFTIDGPKLPRLGHDFKYKDAKLFYNHQKPVIKAKKRSRKVSKRTTLRKRKKTFLESEYNSLVSSMQTTLSDSFITSNTSSVKLKIEFSRKGRKYLKCKMSKKHIDKHASDFENSLKCHKFHKFRKLPVSARIQVIDKFKLFSILYIALNMNDDRIQLGDIIRFTREEHIPFHDTNKYLPPNVIQNASTAKICNQDLLRHYKMRSEIWNFCNFLNINELKMPNMFDLCERYIDELCLPKELNIIIERLIVLCPPEMKFHSCHRMIPNYEGRAMAYIIFVLKICFGLDDERELIISKSAENINKKIEEMNIETTELFVWSKWVKYIEMRNIIIKQCHLPTNLNKLNYNNRSENYSKLLIDHFNKFFIDKDIDIQTKHKYCKHLGKIINSLDIIGENTINNEENVKNEFFFPSLTPNRSYLKHLINNKKENLFIPEYMKVNHVEKSIKPFLKPKLLKQSFQAKNINLLVTNHSLNISNINFVKPFRYVTSRFNWNKIVSTEISSTAWENNLLDNKINEKTKEDEKKLNEHNVILRDILLKQLKDEFDKEINNVNKRKKNKNNYYENLIYDKLNNTIDLLDKELYFESDNEEILNDLKLEIDVDNNNLLKQPRHNLDENILLFDDDTDDDEDTSNNKDTNRQYKKTINFSISNNDYWLHMVHDNYLFPKDFYKIIEKLPKIFQWLLKQCASIIENDLRELYIELLIIENYYAYVLQPISNIKSMLLYQDDTNSTDRLKNDTTLMIKRLKELF